MINLHKISLFIKILAITLIAYPGLANAEGIPARVDRNSADISTNAGYIADNFSAIAGHENRITDLENAGSGSNPDFSGYDPGFSAEGAMKNVLVLAQFEPYGTRYSLRYSYASSTATVSIDGVATQRPFFGGYPEVETNNLGEITGIYNYIETPDTENYLIYNIEESTYDPLSLVKSVTDDSLRESWVCNGSAVNICLATDTLTDGTFQGNYVRTLVRALTGPFTVNGMTFADVRVEYDQGRPDLRTRIRARGIGQILIKRQGQNPMELIYYQANGATGGSLVGTPFEPGVGKLDGLFF